MKKNKSRSGFSMIELLVVATIMAVLSAIGLVSYQKATQSSRNSKRRADLETVRQALVLYKADEGCYPSGGYSTVIPSLVSDGYLSSPAPEETKSEHVAYVYTPSGTCTGVSGAGASGFELQATLEPDTAGTLEVNNP